MAALTGSRTGVPGASWEGVTAEAWAGRWRVPRVELHERIGSTNDRARELADSGAPEHTVVLADEQTSGRGRRGTRWHSPPGCGLWLSTLAKAPPDVAVLPLCVGLAASEAIEAVTPAVQVAIKWPNDLLVGERKVGGVLCEAVGARVVIGIGINVGEPEGGFPDDLRGVATTLEAEGGTRPDRGDLASELVGRLRAWTDGGEVVLTPERHAALRGRDALRGREVMTEQAGPGTAVGIEATGALTLERPDGERVSVVAGSVRVV